MDHSPWRQVNLTFPDYADAEPCAVTHLAPLLAEAEAEGLTACWFFIRKRPCWRVRYLPGGDIDKADAFIHGRLEDLRTGRHIEDVTEIVYEPESHAFGGPRSMACAHRLFHLDSRHLLAYLAHGNHIGETAHRRELSILLCTGLLRAAGLDWYEQGDVWARVCEHRDEPHQFPVGRADGLQASLRRLMSVDPADLMREGSSLAFAAGWAQAYTAAGRELADLTADGRLHRGLRDVLAHHVIFTWNRLGLPYPTQAVLAHNAKTVVFGPDPTLSPA